jgi:hypothetical protein
MITNVFESGTTIRLECVIPDGIGILHYCNDGNNLNITGTYYIDWLTTVAGQYKFLFNASGDLSITQRGSFTVQKLF